MKISYRWLLELTGLDWTVEEVAHRLEMSGTACEQIEPTARYMDRVVVGEVVELAPIAGASKIQLARVNIGSEVLNSVCGAPNVAVKQKVPVALVGARLADDFELKKVTIRGVKSAAMICSERELGLSDDHSGIMVLDPEAPVGKPLAEYLEYDDYILSFELTPNRADSLSAIGIARDLAALASVPLRKPQFDLHESSEKASQHIKVTIDDVHGCPRYAARIIRNVKVGPSPWWLKKRLMMSGIRPISNVVDVTNYVMLETGHPLHAFDLDRFGSNEVVVRKAHEGEKFTTLDGREHELTPDVLLITNGSAPVAAGGVMGGMDSEVEDDTTNILLEAAYFNPSVIRQSRKRLDIVTESSTRFEKGADPNGIPYAIDRAAYLFQQLCGGEVLSGIVDCYPQKIEPVTIPFRPRRCNYVLGTDLSTDRMKQIFTSLEFTVADSEPLKVTVPTFRPDIEREIDLIEEVARIIGYNAIPDAVTNIGPLFTPTHVEDVFEDEVRRIMTAAGFDEMLSHGLADSRLSQAIMPDTPLVRLVNPVSSDLDVMRNSLVPSALTVISHNNAHRNLDLCLFEIGTAYYPPDQDHDWREEKRILIAVTGFTPAGWREKPRPRDFYDVTGAVQQLAEHFHWPALQFETADAAFLEKDISFKIMLDGKQAGVIGKVSTPLLDKLDIKQPVYLAELDAGLLLELSRPLAEFTPLPQYPAAPRDLSVVVARQVRASDLVRTVQDTAGELAESVRIFDLYTGKQIEAGKKSIAISITYRSRTGSLSSADVDIIQQKVIEALKRDFDAEIRDK
jgi:phenylalanyl-tRNA synthetase beta chain